MGGSGEIQTRDLLPPSRTALTGALIAELRSRIWRREPSKEELIARNLEVQGARGTSMVRHQ